MEFGSLGFFIFIALALIVRSMNDSKQKEENAYEQKNMLMALQAKAMNKKKTKRKQNTPKKCQSCEKFYEDEGNKFCPECGEKV